MYDMSDTVFVKQSFCNEQRVLKIHLILFVVVIVCKLCVSCDIEISCCAGIVCHFEVPHLIRLVKRYIVQSL